MKSFCLSLLVILSLNACHDGLNNSAWEVSGMRISFDSTTKENLINKKVDHAVKNKYNKVYVVFKNDKLHQLGPGDKGKVIKIGKITKDHVNYYVGSKKKKIDYDLFENEKRLTLNFPNGNSLKLKRVKFTEELMRKVVAQTK